MATTKKAPVLVDDAIEEATVNVENVVLPTSIFQIIPRVREEVGAVRKDQSTTMGAKYSYRSADQVINALVPVLNKYGVFTTVNDIEHDLTERTVGNKIVTVAKLTKRVTFYAPDGSNVTSTVAAESSDYADKATGSAQTYAYRYALLQTFTLPTDEEDPDARYVEKVIEGAAAPARGAAATTAKPSVTKLVNDIKALIAGTYADAQGTVFDRVPEERINALGAKISGSTGNGWRSNASVLQQVIAEVTK